MSPTITSGPVAEGQVCAWAPVDNRVVAAKAVAAPSIRFQFVSMFILRGWLEVPESLAVVESSRGWLVACGVACAVPNAPECT